jgi:photosystem II stability/assembly factor-like uncharacterized protein
MTTNNNLTMKTTTLLSAFLMCIFFYGAGQSSNHPYGFRDRDSIPQHIRERKAFKRAEWFVNQRAYPDKTIPELRYRNEMVREIQKVKIEMARGNNELTWTSVGPKGIQTDYVNWGVVGGRVRAVAVHPTDPLTVYIGAANGGIWKTSDGGQSWLDIGRELPSLSFGAIAIDPDNPQIIYAGSGECDLLEGFNVYAGDGLYKSTNAGLSWNLITNGFGTVTHFSDLQVSPHNSNMVMASLGGGTTFSGVWLSNEGVWISMDGGITWNRSLDLLDVADIAFHPTDPNTLYAAAGGYLSPMEGFYISTDHGATWTPSNNGLILPWMGGRMQFDISPAFPNVMYAVIYQLSMDPGSGPSRAYKSVDGGQSWTQISTGTQLGGNYGWGWFDQGWYDLCIAIDPEDPNHVLIGNVELHRTTDGSSFTPVRPYGPNAMGSLTHVDYHKLVFAPSDPDILYLGCDGGIYKSTDKGYTSTSLNQGLETLQFYRIASHPENKRILMGGMQDNSSAITTNGGSNWHLIFNADGMECFFDREDPDNVLYGSWQNGVLIKSLDGGDSFFELTNVAGAWTTPFFMHPTDNNTLYAASRKIFKSTNGGNTFQVISGPAYIAPSFISSMEQSQVNPNFMIFGTGLDHPHFDTVFVVKISTDEGATWTDVTANIPGEERWIARVETDPVKDSTMYLLRTGFSPGNKVWKTTDLGQTWTNISGDLRDMPCSDLFIDPESTRHLYVATDIGVYSTSNGGQTWQYASQGMPFVAAIDFDYVKIGSNRYLRVGTYGRSIYETQLPTYCLAGGINFTTQEQIDNFQANYPGCTEIEGDVTIYYGDITNLNGLNILTVIGGYLSIYSELSSLEGLNNINFIGGGVHLESNPNLTNLIGLESLTSIGGNLTIVSNWNLESFTGLNNLTSIGGGFEMYWNAATAITGLENLSSIGGSLGIGVNCSSQQAGNNFSNLNGLESLITIGGNLYVKSNRFLTSLSGLENLTTIGGSLELYHNNILSDIMALGNLSPESISNLTIIYNDSLSDCNAESICTYLSVPNGTIEIHDNAPGCNSQQEVGDACAGVGILEVGGQRSTVSVMPNPAREISDIRYRISDIRYVVLKVHDIWGREVSTLVNEIQSPGEYMVPFDASGLPAGIYLVRLQAGDTVVTEKMVVMR